ncbi:MAG: DUF4440 domain-containing protein [Bacteroidota bacterium]
MKLALPILLCLLSLISCAPPPPDVAEVRKAIDAMNEEGKKNMLAGTMDTTMKHYMDDAVSMPNHGPMLKGKSAIRDYYSGMFKGMKFTKVEFTTEDVGVSGSYAYEVGKYALTMEIPGMGEVSDDGKYLTVYEHAADGTWKIKAETWNTNREMPMPEKKPD